MFGELPEPLALVGAACLRARVDRVPLSEDLPSDTLDRGAGTKPGQTALTLIDRGGQPALPAILSDWVKSVNMRPSPRVGRTLMADEGAVRSVGDQYHL